MVKYGRGDLIFVVIFAIIIVMTVWKFINFPFYTIAKQ